jgi:regulator of replication initiation timing
MNRIRQTAAAAIDSGLPGVFAWIASGEWPGSAYCGDEVRECRLVHERVANAIDYAYLDARRDIEAKRDALDEGADIGEMRQALDRRGEAIEALELELTDLRAKLALQTQIATGAATQRDEQTARLAEAQAEIARLRAERACKQCGGGLDTWCERCDVPDEGEPKASKPTVDVANLAKDIRYNSMNQPLDLTRHDHARRFADWLVNDLRLDVKPTEPATPHDGRVSTNKLTKEEVAFARGDGVLVVSDDGLGSVPREWYERAKKARTQTGEVGT